jgi:hypothetical protein
MTCLALEDQPLIHQIMSVGTPSSPFRRLHLRHYKGAVKSNGNPLSQPTHSRKIHELKLRR